MDSSFTSRDDHDDPAFEYHQDYYQGYYQRESRPPSITLHTVLVFVILAIPVIYQISSWLPLGQFLWNCLVDITPYRLLEIFDASDSLDSILNPPSPDSSLHARKSEKMKRILGLDRGSTLMEKVAQASRRRLSLLPGRGKEGFPPGLGNWDNSCYQNSVLQGLASLDNFSEYLVEPDSGQAREKESMPMTRSLRELIADLRDTAGNGRQIWTPDVLKNMSSYQQQDAQEYYSRMLDEVDKEVAEATKAAKDAGALTDGADNEASNTSSSSLTTVRNPLEGMLVQRVGCTVCGYSEGLSMIPFNCLTVPIERNRENTIAECLDAYMQLEKIEGVECGRCTLLRNNTLLTNVIEQMTSSPDNADRITGYARRLEAVTEALLEDDYAEKTIREKCGIPAKNRITTVKTRQAVIARPPKSLVIHINRSLFDETTGILRKNSAQVTFPKGLDLRPWCLGPAEDAGTEEWRLDPQRSMIPSSDGYSSNHEPNYELRAVVAHYGRHENGHYVCYRKHPVAEQKVKDIQDETWWRLSDDEVTSATEDEVLAQGGVFMLFYDRISDEPGPPPSEQSSISSSESTAASLNTQTPQVQRITKLAVQSSESLDEMLSFAAGIPLPRSTPSPDIDPPIKVTDDPPSSLPMSRDLSHASSISADDQTDRVEEEIPAPAKPIIVKPFIQPHGYRNNDQKDGNGMTGKDSMRTSSRTSSLVCV